MPAQKERTLVQAWIPDETAGELKLRADDSERSVAAEVRIAIRKHLQNDESQPRQAGSVQESSRQARHGQRT